MTDMRGLRQLRDQWRSTPRLRYGAMLIVAILGMQGLFLLSDQVRKQAARHAGDMEMLGRLEALRTESWWPMRAGEARQVLEAVTSRIPQVAGKGMAQAESQAWLSRLAAEQGLAEPRIQVESTVDVDGYPDMWQVISRLDGQLPAHGHEPFVRALADALPWMQVERIEIGEGATPRVGVTFRGYYRKAQPGAAEPSPQATGAPDVHSHPDAADLAR